MFDRRRRMRHTFRVAQHDDDGQRWSEELVKRVGAAVKNARGTKSAKWLSDRTAQLGYRISPTVIAKLDSGHRGNVLSIPELFVLAAAVDIPPALLLFPDYPDGSVELLPGRDAGNRMAVKWLSGSEPLMEINDDGAAEISPPNAGTDLVGAVERLDRIDGDRMQQLIMANRAATPEEAELTKKLIEELDRQFSLVEREVTQARFNLWRNQSDAVAAFLLDTREDEADA